MGFKITSIDQTNSKYTNEGGVFNFVLDGYPDEKWRNKFSDAVNSYRGRNFSKAPVNPVDTNFVEAYAQIHGDKNLEFVSKELIELIEIANNHYDQEVHELAEKQRKERDDRTSLDTEVSNQISKIKFS